LVNQINISLKQLEAISNKHLGNHKYILNKLLCMVSLKGSPCMVNQQLDNQLTEPLKTSFNLNMVNLKHKLCNLKKLIVRQDIKWDGVIQFLTQVQ
jgi:hypothetical protein